MFLSLVRNPVCRKSHCGDFLVYLASKVEGLPGTVLWLMAEGHCNARKCVIIKVASELCKKKLLEFIQFTAATQASRSFKLNLALTDAALSASLCHVINQMKV